MTSLTEEILRCVRAGSSPLTDEWSALGERAFADTVACLVAGAGESSVTILDAVVDEHDGPVQSLASGRWMSTRAAALIDGTAAHALDYDDVDDAVISHPSAVVVPALLAAGQLRDASGAELLRSYRVGLEACRAVGRALDIPSHFAIGWHPTSTTGAIGAAAAVAHLLELDDLGVRHALGIAGSLAGGSRQNFGTMTKPLHAGAAASHGVTAAYLARGGFTADEAQLDGPLGFLALHRDHSQSAQTLPIPESLQLNTKRYSCCYATHAGIEAALTLHAAMPAGTEISSVEVTAQPAGLRPLIHHRPEDGTAAKFSLEYTVAVALLDGQVLLSTFDDSRAQRADVQELLRKVTLSAAPDEASDTPWRTELTVHGTDGWVGTALVVNPSGHASRPLADEQVRAKFDDCFGSAAPDAVAHAFDGLYHLRGRSSIREVVAAVLEARAKPAAGR